MSQSREGIRTAVDHETKNRAVYILYEYSYAYQEFKNSKKLLGTYVRCMLLFSHINSCKKIRGVYRVRVLVPGTRTYDSRDPFSNADKLDTIRVCDVMGVVHRRSMYS